MFIHIYNYFLVFLFFSTHFHTKFLAYPTGTGQRSQRKWRGADTQKPKLNIQPGHLLENHLLLQCQLWCGQSLQLGWGVGSCYPKFPKSDSCNLNYRRIWPCVPPSLHGSPAAVASDVVLFPTGTSWRSVGQCPSCCPSPGMSFLRIMAPCPWQEGCNQVFCQVPSNPKRSMIPCGKKRMENRAGEGNLRLPLAPRQDQPHLCRFNSSYKEKLIQFYEHVHN